MEALAPNNFFKRLNLATNRHICPECGKKMAQVQSQKQKNCVFVWYECTAKECTGQWLQRYQLDSTIKPD